MSVRCGRVLLAAGLVLYCLGPAAAFGVRGDGGVLPLLRVQYGGSQGQGDLVKPSVAARAARKVVNGKVLDIAVSDRGGPVYLVKIRSEGQVRLVVVDARTGRVIGQ